MRQIILSLDYELFFGDKSGTVTKSLIDPTNILLKNFSDNQQKATFFVDYLMLKVIANSNDPQLQSDYFKVKNQIQDMIREGHRVELHIHPHWVDAKYNGDGTWDFSDYTHYSLSSFSSQQISDMFVEGCNILHSIIHEIDPDYKIVAFRAGGWAIQPFSRIKEAFLKSGLFIDSSVCYGVSNKYMYSEYNFMSAPNKEYYSFNEDVVIESNSGCFIEYPIFSYKRFLIYKIIDRISNLFSWSKVITDGTHFRVADCTTRTKRKVYFLNRGMYSTTCVSVFTALFSLIFTRKKLITVIDHPKDFNFRTLISLKILSKITKSTTYFEHYNRIKGV